MTAEHEQVESLLGAYALDAVDPDERVLVEDHLSRCPRCRSEVDSHREVVALIGNSGADAPEGVWGRIQAALDGEAPPLALPIGDGTVVPMRPPADIDRSNGRRAADRVRTRTPWIAAVAAASVALLVGIAVGVGVSDEPAQTVAAIPADISEAARAVLSDDNATHVTLAASQGSGSVEAGWTDDGQGFLVGTSLPALGDDLAYQLWGVSDNAVVSLGVLGPRPGVVAFPANADYSALAITVEVSGGVVSSANDIAYLGQVS